MFTPKVLLSNLLLATFAVAGLFLFSACSVNVKKNAQGEDKKVDIETPFGGIHVNEKADPRDTGLAVYPGAKPKEKDSGHDSKSANVNIAGPGFAVKVVALEYVSSDPPQKLIDFYRDQLKKYGNVLECRTSRHAGDEHAGSPNKEDQNKTHSKQLSCDKGDSGNTVELKVGTEDNQRIVAVEPDGKGSSFALVYVQAHGKHEMI